MDLTNLILKIKRNNFTNLIAYDIFLLDKVIRVIFLIIIYGGFMKRRIIIILITGLLVMFLAGCGKQKTENNQITNQQNTNNENVNNNTDGANNPTSTTTSDTSTTIKRKVNFNTLEEEAEALVPIDICGLLMLDLKKDVIELEQLSSNDKINMLLAVFGDYSDLYDEETLLLSITREDIRRYFVDLTFLNNYKPDEFIYPFKFTNADTEGNRFYISVSPSRCSTKEEEKYFIKYKDSKREGNNIKVEYYYYYGSIKSKSEFNEQARIGGVYFYTDIYKDYTKSEYVQSIRTNFEEDKIAYDKLNTVTFTFDASNDNLRFVRMNRQS